VGQAQSPETDVVALARAIVDGLLETYVLPPTKEIERAERSGGIGRIQQKRSYHSPRACHPQTISRGPARGCKRIAELLKRANEDEIYRVAGQTIAGDGVAGYKSTMKNLYAHSDHVWQNNIGGKAVCKTHREDPWKPMIRSVENDEDYQPHAEYAETEN